MSKKYLWVEDEQQVAVDYIIENKLFVRNLDERDYSNLKYLNKDEAINYLEKKGIFLAQDFNESCKIIFNEDIFDKIILDVKFPTPLGSQLSEPEIRKAKSIFLESHPSGENEGIRNQFEKIFDAIICKDDYSGLLFCIILCLFYNKEKHIINVSQNVCIFTQNNIKFNNFKELVEKQISDSELKRNIWELGINEYISEVENRFWYKNHDDKKLKIFLEKDKYLDILKDRIDSEISSKFLKVLKEKNNKDIVEIGDNLSKMRVIYEEILKVCAKKFKITNLKGKEQVVWLEDNKYINPIQSNFFKSVYYIGTLYGGHRAKTAKIYIPTIDTVNSLVFALKDIILWFDKIS
ncbi:MAG: hypothetical protein KAW92_03280 [Candidatus Cloacimonetes bacterium]|nr:hypothetical protein [Candidatus Cloacimonadota bacterium]